MNDEKYFTSVRKNEKQPGRPPTTIEGGWYEADPDEAMLVLTELKNSGHTWEGLAQLLNDRYGADVSGTLLWKVAKGRSKSERVEVALGLRPETAPVEVCPNCGQVHERKSTCTDKLEVSRSRPKRYRMHYECGRGEAGRRRRERVRAWMERNGWGSLTEAVDELMEVE